MKADDNSKKWQQRIKLKLAFLFYFVQSTCSFFATNVLFFFASYNLYTENGVVKGLKENINQIFVTAKKAMLWS